MLKSALEMPYQTGGSSQTSLIIKILQKKCLQFTHFDGNGIFKIKEYEFYFYLSTIIKAKKKKKVHSQLFHFFNRKIM